MSKQQEQIEELLKEMLETVASRVAVEAQQLQIGAIDFELYSNRKDAMVNHSLAELTAKINKLMIEARNNSLLDLKQWIKLHDLDQEMILDGIEHMVKSNLQVPDQPRLDNSARLKQLTAQFNKGDSDE